VKILSGPATVNGEFAPNATGNSGKAEETMKP